MSSKNSLEVKRERRLEREARKARNPKPRLVQKFIPSTDKYGNTVYLPVMMPANMFK